MTAIALWEHTVAVIAVIAFLVICAAAFVYKFGGAPEDEAWADDPEDEAVNREKT